MTARAVGLFLLLARDASAWGSCRKFSEIYASGQEMCEVLWADAFEYTAVRDVKTGAGYVVLKSR